MSNTYTTTAHGRTITFEIVDTWELNEGDVLFNQGEFMFCGPFEDEVTKYGRTPKYDTKGARWCEAMVSSEGAGGVIPLSWFDKSEDHPFPTWKIQGNTNARWSRILENVPA